MAAFFAVALVLVGQDASAILEKVRVARPGPSELAVYCHDWAPSLREARERAAKEKRPVFFVLVTNSYGDMLSGHC